MSGWSAQREPRGRLGRGNGQVHGASALPPSAPLAPPQSRAPCLVRSVLVSATVRRDTAAAIEKHVLQQGHVHIRDPRASRYAPKPDRGKLGVAARWSVRDTSPPATLHHPLSAGSAPRSGVARQSGQRTDPLSTSRFHFSPFSPTASFLLAAAGRVRRRRGSAPRRRPLSRRSATPGGGRQDRPFGATTSGCAFSNERTGAFRERERAPYGGARTRVTAPAERAARRCVSQSQVTSQIERSGRARAMWPRGAAAMPGGTSPVGVRAVAAKTQLSFRTTEDMKVGNRARRIAASE